MSEVKIKPIVLTNEENGDKFTLEFNRESIRFAESKGFDISHVENAPMSAIPDLFYFAFRMHHRNLTHAQTDKILFEDLGGLSDELIERLGELYAKPFDDLLQGESNAKKCKMSIQL